MFRSISKKLRFLFIGMMLFFSISISLAAFHAAGNYIRNDKAESALQTLQNVSQYYLEEELQRISKAVNYWSVHPIFTSLDLESQIGEQDVSELLREWRSYRILNMSITDIYFSSADGRFFHEEKSQMPSDYRAKDRAWYKAAVGTPHTVIWSKPYKDIRNENQLIMTLSKAVWQSGKIIGVVGADVTLTGFSDLLDRRYANQQGKLILFDETGEVYIHPEISHIGTKITKEPWANRAMSELSGNGYFKKNGVEYLYAFTTVAPAGWKLVDVNKVPSTFLMINLKMVIIAAAMLIVILIMLGGYWGASKIFKPVKNIIEVIQDVSEGNLTTRCITDTKDEFAEIGKALNQMIDDINGNYITTVKALANALEANDPYTRGHCERVSYLAVMLGTAAGLSEQSLKNLEVASILHDIGKIGISTHVLHKPGQLTDEEFKIIKTHPDLGNAILETVISLECSRSIMYQHHERLDGKGYPLGLKSEDIMREAKILAIADSYDAMTSKRPYRLNPMSIDQAISQLKMGIGTQFDEELTELFIHHVYLWDKELHWELNASS